MKWIRASERKPIRQVCGKRISDGTYGVLYQWFDNTYFFVTTDFSQREGWNITNELEEYEWLDESESPAPDGWVRVEERLPEYLECVLIAVKNSGVTEAQYTGSGTEFQSGEYSLTATHWMTLPQPPKQ